VEGKSTEKFGISIHPKKPFITESIEIAFYKYKGKYHINNFCKTQMFGMEECPNLVAHQLIISLLLTIKHTWIRDLEIIDEADYYLPINKKERVEYVREHIKEEYQEQYLQKDSFDFMTLTESHGANLSVINKFCKVLTELGYDVKKGFRWQ